MWNEFINEPSNSYVEDNINLLNSGGTLEFPFDISNNYIDGAYPYPLSLDHFTGSGITIDGNPSNNTFDNMSAYINAHDNQVIRTCNACMNIAAGHDVHFYNNTMISSGKYPDGTSSDRFWGGCCIWDASNVGVDKFVRNDVKNNTIGYVRQGVNTPFLNRQDWVVVPNNPLSIKAGDNISLPNPITKETEDAEFVKWTAKLTQAGIVIGPGGSSSTTSTTSTLPISVPNIVIPLGKTATGKFTPLNTLGAGVGFQSGSVILSSGSTFSAVSLISNQTKFTITPLKIGKSMGTLSYKSTGGKTMTKQFSIEVVDAPIPNTEAIDTKIEFTIP